jgi:hypothetical protein
LGSMVNAGTLLREGERYMPEDSVIIGRPKP